MNYKLIQDYFTNKKPYLTLFLLFIFLFLLYWNVAPYLFVDVGREYLTISQMLNEKLLYKDILNLYGPIPFEISYIFFKIIPFNFLTFSILNAINGLIFILGIYKLSKLYLNKEKSLFFTVVILFISVFNNFLFNFIHPYSICYAFGITFSVYFLYNIVKYFRLNQCKYSIFAYIFASLSFLSKNELCFIPPLLILFLIFYKKNIKNIFLALFTIGIIFLFQGIIFYLQGYTIQDFLNAFNILKKASYVPSMLIFHAFIGMSLTFNNIIILFSSLLFILIQFLILKKYNNIFVLFLLSILYLVNFSRVCHYSLFSCLPIVVLFIMILKFKTIIKNKDIFILGIFSLLFSFKTFFNLYLNAYGTYTFIFLLLFINVYLESFNTDEKVNDIYYKIISVVTITFFLVCLIANLFFYTYKTNIDGYNVRTKKLESYIMNSIVEFIYSETKPNEKILVFPEGELVNYTTNRETDNFLYSLHDIFIETYGDKYIHDRINKSQIKYIIDISDFKLHPDILHKHTYNTNYISNLLSDKFILAKTIFVNYTFGDANTKEIRMYKRISK